MRKGFAAGAALLVLTGGALVPSRASDDFVGIPGELIGQNGPTANVLDGLELVGHTSLALPGQPVLGNHGGIALVDDCAFVGRWHDYRGRNEVTIVDVADAAAPQAIGEVPGSAIQGTVTRELRAVDLDGTEMLVALVFTDSTTARTNRLLFYEFADGDCTRPVLAGTFEMATFRGHEFFLWVDPDPVLPSEGPRVLAFVTAPIGPPNLLVVDGSDPSAPRLVGAYDAGMPVASVDEAAGTYLGTYAHSIAVSDDGTQAHLSYWDGGFFTVDATAVTTAGGTFAPKGAMSLPLLHPEGELGNVHSAVAVPANGTVVLGHEIYESTDGCPYGWMKVVDPGSPTQAADFLGEFRLDANDPLTCVDIPGRAPPLVDGLPAPQTVDARNSLGELVDGTFTMHNQTVVGTTVLASWYGAGLRVVDVADPAQPREIASFVPAPIPAPPPHNAPQTSAPIWGVFGTASNDWLVAMWSYPVVRDGLIYVSDVRNGLYILRAEPGSELAEALGAVRFAEGNSNLGSILN